MRKFLIIAASDIQIEGLPEMAKGGDVLGHLETDCNTGSIWSCLKFGQAVLVPVDETKPSKSRSRSDSKPTDEQASEEGQESTSAEASEPTAEASTAADTTRATTGKPTSKSKAKASGK